MHHIEEVVGAASRITVECRPADRVGGWYATMYLWHGSEVAAVADLLCYGDHIDPFQAEQLVNAVREALSVSLTF